MVRLEKSLIIMVARENKKRYGLQPRDTITNKNRICVVRISKAQPVPYSNNHKSNNGVFFLELL